MLAICTEIKSKSEYKKIRGYQGKQNSYMEVIILSNFSSIATLCRRQILNGFREKV